MSAYGVVGSDYEVVMSEDISDLPDADYCMDKLSRLYDMASKRTNSEDRALCRRFYRNKSVEYFSDIYNRKPCLMKKQLKDNGGDPECPINGRLKGLFFMASVCSYGSESGNPLPSSPFGPSRLLVPVVDLLGSANKPNLYFADFYCMEYSKYHIVTLVITKTGSDDDAFCKKYLPSLNLCKNPFLFVKDKKLYVTTADNLLVEVFYTENLDISRYRHTLRNDIPIQGKGHSTPGGKPKNPSCKVCNLK